MSASSAILEGRGLRLGFHRCGDRFSHTVGAIVEGRLLPLLASVEGTDEELWPLSPALQTLDTQSAGTSQMAMLVGMAGRSHWSLSVELDPARNRIKFDVAVRLKEQPAWLGSSYRTMVTPRPDADSGNALILALDQASVRIEPESASTATLEHGRTQLRATDDGVAICVQTSLLTLPCTVRWGYVISRFA